MSGSVRLSEGFHEFVTAHKRDGETIEGTVRRLIGSPLPANVAGIIPPATAATVREKLE